MLRYQLENRIKDIERQTCLTTPFHANLHTLWHDAQCNRAPQKLSSMGAAHLRHQTNVYQTGKALIFVLPALPHFTQVSGNERQPVTTKPGLEDDLGTERGRKKKDEGIVEIEEENRRKRKVEIEEEEESNDSINKLRKAMSEP